jgi:hypothetical protein
LSTQEDPLTLLIDIVDRNLLNMKSSETLSPAYRRKFLAFIATATASLGVTSAFSRAASTDVLPKGRELDGSVRRFGAKGDGKADDSAAVQSAIDSGSGDVYFPKGTYRITKTIKVDLDKVGYTSIRSEGSAQIVMGGAGPVFRFVGTHFKSADPGNYSDNVWDRQRMPMVDNLAIVGDHPQAVGIEAVGTMQLTITRLHVRKALHGIHLTGNNRNIAISDCHLYENRGIGIYYDDVNLHQSNITGCHISYNPGGGIVSRRGNVRNIHITGCDIESNMGENMPPTANVLIDCSGSAWGTAEVAITGCTIQHNSHSPQSANIRILGGTNAGTPPEKKRWGNITITGNIISDVMVNVHLKDCRGVAISGNTFWEAFQHNILLESCSSIVLGANVFDCNRNYPRNVVAKNSLRISNSEDCNISGLQISNVKDTSALLIEDSRRMNISNCSIVDCDNAGLFLKGVTNSIVTACLIKNDDKGSRFTPLKIEGGKDNLIENNLIS